MNSQQEYELFMMKFLKLIRDINDDVSNLSPENQQRFAREVTRFLNEYGIAVTVDTVIHKFLG